MSATAALRAEQPAPSTLRPARSLSLGFVAMLPLFAAYEWALAARGDGQRNFAEYALTAALRVFADSATAARWIAVLACAVAAWTLALRRGAAALPGAARIVLESALAACVLGPLLVIALRTLPNVFHELELTSAAAAPGPTLAEAAYALGSAAWEELAFRVGAYSLCYWLALRALQMLSWSEGAARALADALGITLSALLFAAAHFAPFLAWFGLDGPPFSGARCAWLILGGLVLGALFRWRGPGVAAWTHGLFNVALWIGIDPGVI